MARHWSGYNRPPLDGLVDWAMGRWSEAHRHAADMRHVNAVSRFRQHNPTSDTYIEVAKRNFKPIDAPRQATRTDVADSTFFGTAVEKRSWWPW